jgi:hypothetical protein
MESAINPVVGQWYRHPDADKGEMFQVIDIDTDEDTVEVQYFDGDIEELPQGTWHAQGLQSCAPPEDWTGPYDEIARDDRGYSDSEPSREERRGATESILGDASDAPVDSTGNDSDE